MTSERLDVDVGVQTPAADVLAALAEAEAAEADARAEASVAKARAAELRDRATHGVGAPTGPAARLGWRRAAALAVGALLIGALLAVTALMSVKHSEAAAARAQDRKLVEAASNGVVALLSIDHGRAEADVQRILDLSIGAFRDDFASRAGDFIKAAQKEKAVTRGSVTAAALETDSGDNAVVLVAAQSEVTNTSGARDDPRPWRMSVTVSRDEDQWKMSNVEFVP
jgi:Mce-associated membrane protein